LLISVSVWAQPKVAPKNSSQSFIETLSDTAWVRLYDVDKTLFFDIKYATAQNFTCQVVYPCADPMLRKEVAMALKKANALFKEKNLIIKIFDAYRPPSAQWLLWKNSPTKLYVSDPRKGSKHSTGASVDITLVNRFGVELDMGTAYDSFSPLSHHNCTEISQTAQNNRLLLKSVMESVGFVAIKSEWWHYNYFKSFSQTELKFDCK
jgi:D-alanyl-D-alanine dipeptidase